MENSELKPCPFCGGEAELDSWYSGGMMFEVDCKDRKCTGSVNKFYRTADEAIDSWNTRAERTCYNNSVHGEDFLCSSCNYAEIGGGWFNACPNCGSRVAGD